MGMGWGWDVIGIDWDWDGIEAWIGIFPLIPAHLHKQGLIIPVFPGNRRKSPLAAPSAIEGPGGKTEPFLTGIVPIWGRFFPDSWEAGKLRLSKTLVEFGVGQGQFQGGDPDIP